MIFSHKAPPFSCRLIEFEKFSTGRVPAARFPWQPGTLADDSCYVNKQNDFDRVLIKNLYLLEGYGAKRLIKEHFSALWIHLRVNLVCIKSFYQQNNEKPHAVHYGAHSTATSPYLLPINDVIVTSLL